MKTVEITTQQTRNLGGSFVCNYEYIVTDELGKKMTGASSCATSQEDVMPGAIKADLQYRLGYSGFTLKFPEAVEAAKRKTLSVTNARA